MKHTHPLSLTPQLCIVLSALTCAEAEGRDGLCTPELELLTDLSRPVLYVLVRRLDGLKYARRRFIKVSASPYRQPIYSITRAGAKAREAYAIELGLRP